LVVFLESGGELEGWGFLVGYHDVGEMDGGGFGEGWESFFDGNEGRGVVKVLAHRGTGGRDGGFIRCLV